jgi:hypothetical protein
MLADGLGEFRSCVLKDELEWSVLDSFIALAHVCVCVFVCVYAYLLHAQLSVNSIGTTKTHSLCPVYRRQLLQYVQCNGDGAGT